MRPQIRGLIIVGVVVVAIAAAVVWTTRSHAPVPEYQNRVAIPGMQQHYVSLWLDPSSPEVGINVVTAQVGDPSGMPIGVDELGFSILNDGGIAGPEALASYVSDAPTQDFQGRGHGYRATLEFTEPGTVNIEVRFRMGDVERTTLFEVSVE